MKINLSEILSFKFTNLIILIYSRITERLSHENAAAINDANANNSDNTNINNRDENNHINLHHRTNDLYGLHRGVVSNQRN